MSASSLNKISNASTQNDLEIILHALHQTAIVSMTDASGNIVMANENFCKISGYSQEELLGQNHRIINSGFHSTEFFAHLWKKISSDEIWSGELCNRRKDGNLYWVDGTITPVIDKNGERKYLSIRYDVTNRKKSEQQLLYGARLASLGKMASGIAHEINNPAGIITGKTRKIKRLLNELLKKPEVKIAANIDTNSNSVSNSVSNSEPTSATAIAFNSMLSDLQNVETATTRITSIVNGLFTFAREESLDPLQSVSLEEIVNSALNFCRERIESGGIELRLNILPNIELVARPSQLTQIILNLIQNAFEATKEATHKWISIEARKLGSDRLLIAVSDSGLGIPKMLADRVMEPFFTTKEPGDGTGLGLSISRGIAQAHGGTLKVDTESTFTRLVLELPLKGQ